MKTMKKPQGKGEVKAMRRVTGKRSKEGDGRRDANN